MDANFEKQMAVGIANYFLEACGQDDDAAVARLLDDETVAVLREDPPDAAAEWARGQLGGLSTGDCARLAASFYDRLDDTRSALYADGSAYLVLQDGDRRITLAVRNEPDRINVTPGAELGVKAGIRIRLTRKRSSVGGQAILDSLDAAVAHSP